MTRLRAMINWLRRLRTFNEIPPISRISLFHLTEEKIFGSLSCQLLKKSILGVCWLCKEHKRNTEKCTQRVKKIIRRIRVRFQEKVCATVPALSF
jgi:hypothetical protein